MENWFRSRRAYDLFATAVVILAGFLDAMSVNMFLVPGHIISTGFTGLAVLLNSLSGGRIDISLAMILFNLPAVILCYRAISPRFTLLSCLFVLSSSLSIRLFHFAPLFDDPLLLVLFGGVLSGAASVMALKVDASAGGMDFIALYFSNKYNRTVWRQVFLVNAVMIVVLGFAKGWLPAGYSILFQFVATRIVTTFHTRYKRVTLQIMTARPDDILAAFIARSLHGLTCTQGYGGYSRRPITMITTVVSSYESQMLIHALLDIDPQAIINVVPSEDFYGKFVQKAY
jgi:uncharacterized membrane-anchored protein YitT (DUF2179 family)